MTTNILPSNPVSTTDAHADTTFLSDNTPVPGTAVFRGGCAFSQAGSAYICPKPAGGTANQTTSYINGRAVRGDGAQIFLNGGTIAQYQGNVAYTALGELVADTTAPVRFNSGVGTSETGIASVSAIV